MSQQLVVYLANIFQNRQQRLIRFSRLLSGSINNPARNQTLVNQELDELLLNVIGHQRH